MRRLVIVGAAVVGLTGAVGLGWWLGTRSVATDSTVAREGAFYSSGPLRLIVETATGAVSAIDVPEGVLLGVEVLDGTMGRAPGSAHDFSGDLRIRARRADELAALEGPADELLAQAQFVLRLDDVGLTIER